MTQKVTASPSRCLWRILIIRIQFNNEAALITFGEMLSALEFSRVHCHQPQNSSASTGGLVFGNTDLQGFTLMPGVYIMELSLDTRLLTCGVPQGCILSCILFIKQLEKVTKRFRVWCHQYCSLSVNWKSNQYVKYCLNLIIGRIKENLLN